MVKPDAALADIDAALTANRAFRNDLLRRRVDRLLESACPETFGLRYWQEMCDAYHTDVARGAPRDPVWDQLFTLECDSSYTEPPGTLDPEDVGYIEPAAQHVCGLELTWPGVNPHNEDVLLDPPDGVYPPPTSLELPLPSDAESAAEWPCSAAFTPRYTTQAEEQELRDSGGLLLPLPADDIVLTVGSVEVTEGTLEVVLYGEPRVGRFTAVDNDTLVWDSEHTGPSTSAHDEGTER